MSLSEDLSSISDQLKMVAAAIDDIAEGPAHESDPADPSEDYAEGEGGEGQMS